MKPYISDIMNDGQQMIFLLEVPIITNDRFDGVVYGGISADFLSDIVVDLAMGSDGVAYVLDNKGNVIGHREVSIVEEGSNMIEAAKADPSVADLAHIIFMETTNLWGLPLLAAIKSGASLLRPARGSLKLLWIEALC